MNKQQFNTYRAGHTQQQSLRAYIAPTCMVMGIDSEATLLAESAQVNGEATLAGYKYNADGAWESTNAGTLRGYTYSDENAWGN